MLFKINENISPLRICKNNQQNHRFQQFGNKTKSDMIAPQDQYYIPSAFRIFEFTIFFSNICFINAQFSFNILTTGKLFLGTCL